MHSHVWWMGCQLVQCKGRVVRWQVNEHAHMCLCTHMTRGNGVGHQVETGRGKDGEIGTGKRMVG